MVNTKKSSAHIITVDQGLPGKKMLNLDKHRCHKLLVQRTSEENLGGLMMPVSIIFSESARTAESHKRKQKDKNSNAQPTLLYIKLKQNFNLYSLRGNILAYFHECDVQTK